MQALLFDAGRRSRPELLAFGRSLRDDAPRRSHAGWRPDPERPDPLSILRVQGAGRVEELLPIRYGRMLASPFTFYRGAAAVMAWDLYRTPSSGVHVQAGGDVHMLNFGAYASAERNVVFDINDFDETLPAPWEYDVKRLAASVLIMARSQGYKEARGQDAIRTALHGYCEVIEELSGETTLEVHYAHVNAENLVAEIDDPRVSDAMRDYVTRARRRTNLQAFQKFVTSRDGELRFVDDPPLLVRLSEEESERFHVLFNRYRATLQSDRRHVLEQYRFRDAARKVVGVGSVGLLAYVMLLEGRGDPDPLVVQIKEAVSSVLTPYLGRSGYDRHGERVVAGQRMMQATSDPFLGWAPFADRDFYVRQLRDMKGPRDQAIDDALFEASAALCGGTLARAHARSVDPGVLHGYLGRGEAFADAISDFAVAYADQNDRDHARLERAVRTGEIAAELL